MSFVRVCELTDLKPDSALRVELDGTAVAVVRGEADDVYAIRDECSHENVALSDGEVDGNTIECWLHGSLFDLRTGNALCLPATRPVPVYAVRVEGTDVLVDTAAHPHEKSETTSVQESNPR